MAKAHQPGEGPGKASSKSRTTAGRTPSKRRTTAQKASSKSRTTAKTTASKKKTSARAKEPRNAAAATPDSTAWNRFYRQVTQAYLGYLNRVNTGEAKVLRQVQDAYV